MTSCATPARRALTLLAALFVVTAVALAGCGSDDPTPPPVVVTQDGTPIGTLPASTPEPAAETPSVTDLMTQAGCDGGVIEPQLFTRETGRCTLNGQEIDVATFDSATVREQWIAIAVQNGVTARPGPDDGLWAASSIGAAGVDAFIEAYNAGG